MSDSKAAPCCQIAENWEMNEDFMIKWNLVELQRSKP